MTAATASVSTTPTLRATGRRWLFWIVVAVLVIVAATASMLITSPSSGGVRLDPGSPAPAGAQAVAEVLRSQGVDVVAVDTSAAALEALDATWGTTADEADETTLVVHDPSGFLDEAGLDSLAGLAAVTVLLEPGFAELEAFADRVDSAGIVDGEALPECSAPIPERAGAIVGEDVSYRIADGAEDAIGCYPGDDGQVRVVQLRDGDRQVVVLGATTALTNEAATTAGNGALALGLLGQQPRLVWLTVGIAELAGTTPPTIGDLSPGWVVPFSLLAILVAIAAAVVLGRRMGPLIVEPLPVIVPASETMRGRARLYARSGARLRAADALRIGAIGRIAKDAGLASTATVDEVCRAVAAITGAAPQAIRDVLVDRVPRTDAELVDLSDGLRRLEHDVRRRSRP